MTQRKPALATRVSPVVNTSVRQLTKALGITISEHLRKLILDDLECMHASKQMFWGEFKKTVEQSQTKDRKVRIEDNIRKLWSEPGEEEENHETLWYRAKEGIQRF